MGVVSSLSYDRLEIRCLANFVIFYTASSFSEALKRRRKRKKRARRRSQRKSGIDVNVDIDADGVNVADADLDARAAAESHLRSLRFAAFGALVHAPACSLFFGMLDSAIPGRGPREVAAKLLADRVSLAPALLFVALFWMKAPSPLSFVSDALFAPDEAVAEEEEEGQGATATEKEQQLQQLQQQQNHHHQQHQQQQQQQRRRQRHSTALPLPTNAHHDHDLFLEQLSSAADDAGRRLPRAYVLSCLFWVPAHSLGFAAVKARWRVLYVALCSLVWNVLLAWISTGGGGGRGGSRSGGSSNSGGGGRSSSSSSTAGSTLPLFSVTDAQRKRHRKERWSG